MYAIAFDLVVAEAEKYHPKGFSQAYADIGQLLNQFGFERVQGSLYVTKNEDMANLFSACSHYAPCLGSHPRFAIFEHFVWSNGPTLLP
jgi:virulence-associated protein VapD